MTKRADVAVWWLVGVVAVLGLIYAGVIGWAVLNSVNWDLLFGNTDWNPGNLTTAPPPPPVPQVPDIPGGGGLPVPPPAPPAPPAPPR